MTIEQSDTEIIIKLPKRLGVNKVKKMVDFFMYKEIVSKSKATQKDIDELVKLIKKERKPRLMV